MELESQTFKEPSAQWKDYNTQLQKKKIFSFFMVKIVRNNGCNDSINSFCVTLVIVMLIKRARKTIVLTILLICNPLRNICQLLSAMFESNK